MRDHANDYGYAKASRVYLEQFRKSKKAMLIIEAEKNGRKTSQEREAYAYTHEEYMKVLCDLKVAVQEEEKYKMLMKSAELKVEIWRTKQANNRIERKAYNA